MIIDTSLAGKWVIEAWAEVPPDTEPEDFKQHLLDLGNDVGEFNAEEGPNGAFKIGTFHQQEH